MRRRVAAGSGWRRPKWRVPSLVMVVLQCPLRSKPYIYGGFLLASSSTRVGGGGKVRSLPRGGWGRSVVGVAQCPLEGIAGGRGGRG